ncbi:MAG: serine hydrolase [Spirulinaceae cyanobacterium]
MDFFHKDEQLEKLGANLLDTIWENFPNLARDRLALTWIVYDEPIIVNTGGALSPEEFWQHQVRSFNYRGVERIYPASVVKLFYLVAIQQWLETAMVADSPELARAIKDMIVDSSNDATSLVVDVLSGTTSGTELSSAPFETWQFQRNIVNRYYQSLGWAELNNINVNQKTWCDGPYGRERAFVGELMENRNMLSTNAVAKLFHSIIGGVAVSGGRSQMMMSLLKRDLANPHPLAGGDDENQVTGFLGEALPSGSQQWSKAGWTSRVRHDAVYVEMPNKQPYILVVFTEGKEHSQNRELLPFISDKIANC